VSSASFRRAIDDLEFGEHFVTTFSQASRGGVISKQLKEEFSGVGGPLLEQAWLCRTDPTLGSKQ
jgi:hypothetical protein